MKTIQPNGPVVLTITVLMHTETAIGDNIVDIGSF